MSIGIYKIQNQLNGKVYIGQSIHIEKRWQEHCRPSSQSLIAKAIQKYGKENFSFQILKECAESELDKFEEKYIKQFNSLAPNGYNIVLTSEDRTISFNKNNYAIFEQIVYDIQKTSKSFKEIADSYDLDLSMIYYINRGDYHTFPNLQYPLRKVKDVSKQHNYCIDCGTEIGLYAIRCSKCDHIKQRKADRPDRESLKNKIRNFSFVAIGNEYGVTDSAIKKWCKDYNLPYRRKDIKLISDLAWEQI